MRTKRKMRPGDPGTKKYVTKYGNELVCVRYRYDDEKQMRYTTVELIVESGPRKERTTNLFPKTSDGNVYLKISPDEDALIEQIKLFGAEWDENRKLWKISSEHIKELTLSERVIN
jgi:hypothetical protein